jgi:hypothetical protein
LNYSIFWAVFSFTLSLFDGQKSITSVSEGADVTSFVKKFNKTHFPPLIGLDFNDQILDDSVLLCQFIEQVAQRMRACFDIIIIYIFIFFLEKEYLNAC